MNAVPADYTSLEGPLEVNKLFNYSLDPEFHVLSTCSAIGDCVIPSRSHDLRHSRASMLVEDSLDQLSLMTSFPLENSLSASADIDRMLRTSRAILVN